MLKSGLVITRAGFYESGKSDYDRFATQHYVINPGGTYCTPKPLPPPSMPTIRDPEPTSVNYAHIFKNKYTVMAKTIPDYQTQLVKAGIPARDIKDGDFGNQLPSIPQIEDVYDPPKFYDAEEFKDSDDDDEFVSPINSFDVDDYITKLFGGETLLPTDLPYPTIENLLSATGIRGGEERPQIPSAPPRVNTFRGGNQIPIRGPASQIRPPPVTIGTQANPESVTFGSQAGASYKDNKTFGSQAGASYKDNKTFGSQAGASFKDNKTFGSQAGASFKDYQNFGTQAEPETADASTQAEPIIETPAEIPDPTPPEPTYVAPHITHEEKTHLDNLYSTEQYESFANELLRLSLTHDTSAYVKGMVTHIDQTARATVNNAKKNGRRTIFIQQLENQLHLVTTALRFQNADSTIRYLVDAQQLINEFVNESSTLEELIESNSKDEEEKRRASFDELTDVQIKPKRGKRPPRIDTQGPADQGSLDREKGKGTVKKKKRKKKSSPGLRDYVPEVDIGRISPTDRKTRSNK